MLVDVAIVEEVVGTVAVNGVVTGLVVTAANRKVFLCDAM